MTTQTLNARTLAPQALGTVSTVSLPSRARLAELADSLGHRVAVLALSAYAVLFVIEAAHLIGA
jgi:hypothetical protein